VEENLFKNVTLRDSLMTRRRILILEDMDSDADLMEFELQDAGIPFTSRRAKTESDYVQALQEFSPDLILSDYHLPQYTGALALAAAKRICPETPFVLVTGAIDKEDGLRRGILSQGARECVFKNRLERLPPVIRQILNVNNRTDSDADKRES
jgi:CheY-like chemotaxis protein